VLLGVDGKARLCYSLDNKEDFGNIKQDNMEDILRKKRQVYPPGKNSSAPSMPRWATRKACTRKHEGKTIS